MEVDELLVDLNCKNFYCFSLQEPKKKMLSKKRKRAKDKVNLNSNKLIKKEIAHNSLS